MSAVAGASEVADQDGTLDPMVRRRTLVRFELRRDSSRSNLQIAKAIGTAPHLVARARAELVAFGEIDPPPSRAKVQKAVSPERRKAESTRRRIVREAAVAEMKKHPDHADGWIASRVGTTQTTARRIRRELEVAGLIPVVTELVRSDGVTARRKTPIQ